MKTQRQESTGAVGRVTPCAPFGRSKASCSAHGVTRPTLKCWLIALALLSTFNSQLSTACAQSYAIDWFTIDGGGGTSTSGVYVVSGTIGQPDAGGPMTGGQFTLQGGFWALPTAVQSSYAPTLLIGPAAPGFATVSWTPATPGCVLQVSPTLTPPAWTNAPTGATNPATIQATPPARFYRLFKTSP